MTDLVTFGETMLRLSPPQGERLETVRKFDVQAGGAESNVAVAASRLGTDAAWLSKLPNSALGNRVVGELRSHGVRTGVSWADPDRTRLGTYYLEHGGEPRGSTVVYDRTDSAFTTVTPEELPTGVFERAEIFHTTGITPALSERTAETTTALLKAAGEAGVTRSFDLNYRAKLWSPEAARASFETLFPQIDILFMPLRDARQVLGYEGEDAVEVAHSLKSEYEFDTVVVTRGEQGSIALRNDELYEQDVFAADTHDAIGTGDAFVAGFLTKQMDGGDHSDALEWAAATAALKRTISGDAAVVSPDEVRTVVEGGTEIDR